MKIYPENNKSIFANNIKLQEVIRKYNITNIEPLFPNSKTPSRKTSMTGDSLVDLSRFFLITITDDSQKQSCINRFNKTSHIEYAEPRYIQQLLYTPNDPMNANQYYLDKIQAYDAWDIQQGDTNIIIAISDTGIDIDHEDLIYHISYNTNDPLDGIDNDNDGYIDNFRGWDLGDNDNNPQEGAIAHGVYVSGLASASTDNGLGISGTGYNCPLLPIKIIDQDTLLTKGYESIIYAADHGASIVNCSWGNNYYSKYEQDIINYATFNHDMLVVAAAGNDKNLRNFYPASYDNVLSVAGTTSLDEIWTPENAGTSGGSSYGYHVDVSAPSILVLTTKNGGGYGNAYAGTSFASPICSGVAALVRSQYPDFTALQCIERIKNTTDLIDTIPYNIPYADLIGTGRINCYRAVSDTLQPGLEFRNITIMDDRENNYENSTTVEITGQLFNFLRTANNVEINISTENSNINILTPYFNPGTIESIEGYSFNETPISFELLSSIGYDEQIILRLDITDGEYHRLQYIETSVKPSYKNINNGHISLSVPANGRLGFVDDYRDNGNGLTYLTFSDLFYDSGLIIGTSAENLVDAVRVSNEFTTDSATMAFESPYADSTVKSQFSAYEIESSINLDIKQQIFAWNDQPNFLLMNYELINQNIVDLQNLYSGIFVDWDLYKPSRNKVSWDNEYKIAYAEHTGDTKLYAGFVLLSNQNANHYALDQSYNNDGLVDMTNGFSEEEKFYCLSHTKNNSGENEEGSDIAQVFSTGPFEIGAQDTVRVSIGLLVAQSLYELQIASDSIRYYYQQIYPDNSSITDETDNNISIWPNPTKNEITIQIPQNDKNSRLKIFDIQGRLVREYTLSNTTNKVLPELPNGHYIISIEGKNLIYKEKLIISDVD